MITIEGKTALITDSSRGIGRGIALEWPNAASTGSVFIILRTGWRPSRVRECGAEPLLLQADIEFVKTTRFRSVDRKTVGGWSLAIFP
jgi:NAD(P)-dependent dehydrogenase (short-subunit alcohol dehydrogenase family)